MKIIISNNDINDHLHRYIIVDSTARTSKQFGEILIMID